MIHINSNEGFTGLLTEIYQTDQENSLKKFNEDIEETVKKMRQDFLYYNKSSSGDKIALSLRYEISVKKDEK